MNTQPMSHQPRRFVLCFSPKDADGKAELVAHMASRRETVTTWSDDEVSAGDSHTGAFLRAAESADAALLLLSADFFGHLDVPTFAEQVEQLRAQKSARGLALIPVLWRDCDWHAVPWLRGCKPLPRDGIALRSLGRRRRDRALAEIVRQLDGRTLQFRTPHGTGLRPKSWKMNLLFSLLFVGIIGGAVALGPSSKGKPSLAGIPSDLAMDHATAPALWKVEGIVRNVRMEPLAGIKVSLPELETNTQTSEQGHFRFVVPVDHDGLVLLRAEQLSAVPGFKHQYQPTEVHASLGSTTLDIVLEDEP